MKRHTDKLPKRLVELQNEVVQDLELNDINLHDKSMKCPGIKCKWTQIFFEEEQILKQLEEKLERDIEEYIEKHGKMGIPKFKSDAEARKSEAIQKIEKAIKQQKLVVRYLSDIVKIVNNFGYDIKNSTDILKLEN